MKAEMKILLTGGAGYIGSHTAVEMLKNGYDIVIIDNLSNSGEIVIDRIKEITQVDNIPFYPFDVSDKEKMHQIFSEHDINGVIHFAGLKAVGESVAKPVEYYRNNLDTTLTLLEVMREFRVRNLVFSSSASVYGEENKPPYTEEMAKGNCSNPYGRTKTMIEEILMDTVRAYPEFSIIILRCFNPLGAHESGKLGEDPQGTPNNLMSVISQVALGKRPKLTVFGGDWDTPDGTCRRDYIHVMDLAEGHVKAMDYALHRMGTEIFNLGTGTPYSVLDIINTFKRVNGIDVPYEIGKRRDGDLQDSWADVKKAEEVLGWTAKRNLEDMCRDSWN